MFTATRHGKNLCVHGSVMVYTDETEVVLFKAEPQGFNPSILLLNLNIIEKPGPMKGTPRLVHYDEEMHSDLHYSQVQITSNRGESWLIDVENDSIYSLPGKLLRVYKTGEAITQDLVDNRFNIETDKSGESIVSVWFG